MQAKNGNGELLELVMFAEDGCNDPTLLPNNVATVFSQSDNTVASTQVVSRNYPIGVCHYNINKNAAGLIVSISGWGHGASGSVGGY